MPPKPDKPPASLTVPLLRDELAKRGLATTGLTAELVARLTEAIEKGGGGGGGEDDGDGNAEMVKKADSQGGLVVPVLLLLLLISSPRRIHINLLYVPGLGKGTKRSSLHTEIAR